jgi:hypothetical protein
MSIEAYFRMQFELLPPGEPLVLSRDRWDWILSTRGTGAGPTLTAAGPGAQPRPAVYGVAALAKEFGMPESSMRALLRQGICGNPTQLKPSGPRKAYQVPAHIVASMREAIAAGHAPGTFCLIHLAPPWPDLGPRETTAHLDSTRGPVGVIEPHPIQQQPPTAARNTVPPGPRSPERQPQRETISPAIRHPTTSRTANGAATDLGGWRKVVAKRGPATPP